MIAESLLPQGAVSLEDALPSDSSKLPTRPLSEVQLPRREKIETCFDKQGGDD